MEQLNNEMHYNYYLIYSGNGIQDEYFRPEKDIRKGDHPISSYSFILLNISVDISIKVSKNSLLIPYLMFIDDYLIFLQSEQVSSKMIKDILHNYSIFQANWPSSINIWSNSPKEL